MTQWERERLAHIRRLNAGLAAMADDDDRLAQEDDDDNRRQWFGMDVVDGSEIDGD